MQRVPLSVNEGAKRPLRCVRFRWPLLAVLLIENPACPDTWLTLLPVNSSPSLRCLTDSIVSTVTPKLAWCGDNPWENVCPHHGSKLLSYLVIVFPGCVVCGLIVPLYSDLRYRCVSPFILTIRRDSMNGGIERHFVPQVRSLGEWLGVFGYYPTEPLTETHETRDGWASCLAG